LPHFLTELGKIRYESPRNAFEQFVFGENQGSEIHALHRDIKESFSCFLHF
jgi:hypothetical protein